jgi:hypothetical protein
MERKGVVSHVEWRWVIVWIVVALIVTSVPYVIGWSRSTPDKVFGGFVIAIEDGYSYLAKMNEGAHGAWLFTLPYTSEPHTATLFYTFHLLLGKIATLTGLTLIAVYHLARLIFDALLLIVTYRFLAMFTGSRAVRRIAFVVIVFSGGLGWLLLLLGQANWLNSYPVDLISPEAFTFLILLGFPHLALARTLMLLGLTFLWQGIASNQKSRIRNQRWLFAGVCWLGMGIIVPFYVAVVGAIVIAGLAVDSIAHRRINWHDVRASILAGLIAAPILIYTFVVVGIDPIWNVWANQLVILSPHPLHYLLGYALVGTLAIVGLVRNPKSRIQNPKLLGWLIVVPFLIYLPFNSQRRLIEGWQIPLSIFAASGLVYVVLPAWRRSRVVQRLSSYRRYSSRGLRSWLLASLLFFSAATYVLLLVDQSMRMTAQVPPSFRDGREVEALRWLDQRVTYEDVVLSSYNTGNYLPAQVGARVFLGHGPETVDSENKRQLVAKFYDAATSDEWRRARMREWSITYVIVGPLEKQLGNFDPSHAVYLSLEYDRAGYRIYRNLAR